MTTNSTPFSLAAVAACFALFADVGCAQTVDFPGVPLASPPATSFPFYTPGSGSTGETVRYQVMCPAAFLAAQNQTAGLVTRIGFSLAGQAAYDVFELRAGTTQVAALGSDWAVNLPDQRVQRDLANVMLQGGGTPAAPLNQWVEFDLDFPFYWQPGDNLVVDVTTHVAVPGAVCGTTTANGGIGGISRAVNFSYTAGAPATSFNSSGIAVRFVFATTDLVTFGAGCSSGATAPSLSSLGDAAIGSAMVILVDDTLVDAIGTFICGFSRRDHAGAALPLPLGGNCELLVSPDILLPAGAAGTQSAWTLAVPFDPVLRGAVIYTQWAQLDAASPATVPLTFSDAGAIVVY